jgi:hypothetical protein
MHAREQANGIRGTERLAGVRTEQPKHRTARLDVVDHQLEQLGVER